jgi:hypothetical protein
MRIFQSSVDNSISAFFGNNSRIVLRSSSQYSAGAWHNLTVVRNATTGRFTVYWNGAVIYNEVRTLGDASKDITNVIGAISAAGADSFLGRIKATLFNQELSRREIDTIVATGGTTDNPFKSGLILQLNGRSYEGTAGAPTKISDTGNNIVPLAVGTSGSVLRADPGEVNGVKWSDDAPTISTGTAAPATTPTKVGDTFIDTTNGNIYIAKGITNSSDWVQVNN